MTTAYAYLPSKLGRPGFLTAEAERELARRRDDPSLSGEERREAVRVLIERNVPWARRLAIGYSRYFPGRFDDIESAAMLGLCQATRQFDPGRGFRLTTMATWWIKKCIFETIYDEAPAIRIPRNLYVALLRYRRGESPGGETDAERSRMDAAGKLLDLRRVGLCGGEDEPASPSWLAAREDDIGDRVDETDRAARLRAAVASLEPRLALVVRRRFALDGHDRVPFSELGRELGISKERVRQLETIAVDRLRDLLSEEVAS